MKHLMIILKAFRLILLVNLFFFSCLAYGQEEKRVDLDERFSVTLGQEQSHYTPYTEGDNFFPDTLYKLYTYKEKRTEESHYAFSDTTYTIAYSYILSNTKFHYRTPNSSVSVYRSYDLNNYKLMRKLSAIGSLGEDSLIINFLEKKAKKNYSDAFIHGGGVVRYKQNKPEQLFDKYWYIDAWIKRRHPESSRELLTRYMRYIFVDSSVYSISVASRWCYRRDSCRCRANAKKAFRRLIQSIRIKEEEE